MADGMVAGIRCDGAGDSNRFVNSTALCSGRHIPGDCATAAALLNDGGWAAGLEFATIIEPRRAAIVAAAIGDWAD